jgi:hypothetical protein
MSARSERFRKDRLSASEEERMHQMFSPSTAGGSERLARASHVARRALGFVASVALVAAALVTVAAPSASANGTESSEDITSCTFDEEQHVEVLLSEGVISFEQDMQRSAIDQYGDEYFYFWEKQSFFYFGVQEDYVTEDLTYRDLTPMPFDQGYVYNSSSAGSVFVLERSRVENFDLDAFDGDGPLGDPLCSLTIVFMNEDGSDPRPSPQATPVSTPPSVGCEPMPAAAGATVTCSVTGGDPGIDILWRASYNPVFAEAGVTLGADGSGTFSFAVPAAALGQEVMVELVDWTAPMSLGVADGASLVPTSVPAGEGPGAPAGPLAATVALALVAGMVVRRRASDLVG